MADGPTLPTSDSPDSPDSPDSDDVIIDSASVYELLTRNALNVPDTQRTYRWKRKQVLELAEDTWAHFTARPSLSFVLGTARLARKATSPMLQAFDGQHRCLTLSTLSRAAYDYLATLEKRTPEEDVLLSSFALTLRKEADRVAGDQEFKLDGDGAPPSPPVGYTPRVRHYQPELDALLCEMQVQLHRPVSPGVGHAADLYGAYTTLSKWIRTRSRGQGGRRHVAAWLQQVLHKTLVIIEVSPDVRTGEQAFAQSNDRGLPSSAAEILRSELLGAAEPDSEERARAARNWDDMELEVRGVRGGEDKFLKAYAASLIGQFKADIRRALSNTEQLADVVSTTEAMALNAKWYRMIFQSQNPNDGRQCGALVDLYALLPPSHAENVRTALLTAAGANAEAFEVLARMLRAYMLVQSVLDTKRDNRATHLQDYLAPLAKVTTKDEAEALAEAFAKVHITPHQDEFLRLLPVTALTKENYPRIYLGLAEQRLERLQSSLFKPAGSLMGQYGSGSNVTIEHILPQTPLDEAVKEYGTDRDTALSELQLLGNLTLLDGNGNSSAQNSLLSQKRGLYQRSKFLITRATVVESRELKAGTKERAAYAKITACGNWTQQQRDTRGRELADLVWEEIVESVGTTPGNRSTGSTGRLDAPTDNGAPDNGAPAVEGSHTGCPAGDDLVVRLTNTTTERGLVATLDEK